MINLLKRAIFPLISNSLRGANNHKFYKFSFSNVVDDLLSGSLKRKISWKSTDVLEKPVGDLFEIWSQIPGAHKWHHYFPIYEKVLGNLREKPIRILEIGVYKGASLKMWKRYFHKDTLIVGIDIDPECEKLSIPEENLHIRVGSQADFSFLEAITDEFGKFDLIIDDGSHIASHMISSFNSLFDVGLKESGIYLVEDTHSNFWDFPYRDIPVSFVDFSKHLIDLMHYHYTLSNEEKHFRLNGESKIDAFEVPYITCMIDEIRYFDSIIVIYKTKHKNLPISEHL